VNRPLLLLAVAWNLAVLPITASAQQPSEVAVVDVLMVAAGQNDSVVEALRDMLHTHCSFQSWASRSRRAWSIDKSVIVRDMG